MADRAAESQVRVFVGRREELPDGTRRIVSLPEAEVGLIVHAGTVYAYRNRCVHQGGPVCEGIVIGRVEAVLGDDRTVLGERFSETEFHLVCPWHGVEYRLADGVCQTKPNLRLRRYEVLCEDGDVYVLCDAREAGA
jgi:nitrite reductase (NADH) small subunit